MNTPSPLVPQGSLTAKPKGKTNFRIAVFTVLAIHAVLLIGLLMQGCKPKREETAAIVPKTNELDFPPVTSLTNAGVYYNTNPVPVPETNAGTNPLGSLPSAAPSNVHDPVPAFPEPAPTPGTPRSEYTVIRGDSFAKIAKAKGVTVNAIQEANPGVDSKRLKVGQKIAVPAGVARLAPNGGANGGTAPRPLLGENGAARSTTTYVVKPGDTLTRIAKQHGVTLSVLRAENNLRTDQIKVGQKVKVPARLSAMKPTETAAAPATLPALSAPTNTATP